MGVRALRAWVAALSLLAALVLPSGEVAAESRFSLSIGHNLGEGQDEPLRWAERDAERFDALMGQLGGMPQDRRVLLLGEDVRTLSLAMARLAGRIQEARRAGERTVLVVYYSGHGDPEALRLGGERLALAELQRWLREVPATATVVILDSCHSGAVVRGRGKGVRAAEGFSVSMVRDVGPEGRVLISSAGANEVAQESDALQGSYFTHHLLSALRGAADADGNGRVSLGEMYQHVYHRTLSTSHGSTAAVQHPELLSQLAGEGDLFLSFLERGQSELEVPEGVGGNLMVVDERTQQVVAEVVGRERGAVRLALPSGRYRVQVRRGAEVLYGQVYLPWGGRVPLPVAQLERRTLAQHQQKGALLAPVEWKVAAGGGMASSYMLGGTWGPGAAVLLERRAEGRLALGAQLSFLSASAEKRYLRFRSSELELTGSVGAHLPVLASRVGVHLGAGVVGMLQHSVHREAERIRELTGLDARYDRVGLGGTGSLALSAELPLGPRLGLWARAAARVGLLREDQRLQLQPGALVLLGATWGR